MPDPKEKITLPALDSVKEKRPGPLVVAVIFTRQAAGYVNIIYNFNLVKARTKIGIKAIDKERTSEVHLQTLRKQTTIG